MNAPHYETNQVRTPPFDEDAERALLGCVMLDPRVYVKAAQRVGHKDFYREPHRLIWRAVGELSEAGTDIDAITVADRIDAWGKLEAIGSMKYIHSLSNAMPSAASVGAYAEIVAEKSRLRRMIRGLESIVGDCYASSIAAEDAVARTSTLVRQVADRGAEDVSHPQKVAEQMYEYVEAVMNGEISREYTCGVKILDALTKWELGKYHLIGAYSGHGKTTLCAAAAGGLAYHHNAVVSWWNCEIAQIFQAMRIMTPLFAKDAGGRTALLEQWLMHPDRVPQERRDGFWRAFTKAVSWFRESSIFIQPPGRIRVRDVELTAQSLKLEYPDRPLVVVVDYLQHCTTEAGSRQSKSDRVSEASARLSHIAKELDCIVLVAAQFTESDYNPEPPIRMPKVAQVRDSKDARNDADKFLAYHRPWIGGEHYNDIAVLETGKDRWGVNAHVVMTSNGATNTFEGYEGEAPDKIPGLHSRRINTWGR